MNQMKHGTTRLSRFFRTKGVYVALAAGILALGGVGAAMTGQMLSKDKGGTSSLPPDEIAGNVVTGQADDRTTQTTTTHTTVAAAATTTAPEKAPDLYILPLSNTVQKAFSVDKPLYSDTMQDWRIHTGADFAGKQGQTVKAVAAGTVTNVEKDALWGPIIVIDHGVGVQSRYCGVKPSVKKGDKVDAGHAIGTLSEIPCESSQAPHLHLEMTIDGRPVDPVAAIGKTVRYAEKLDD